MLQHLIIQFPFYYLSSGDLTWKRLVFWKTGRLGEAVATQLEVRLYKNQ